MKKLHLLLSIILISLLCGCRNAGSSPVEYDRLMHGFEAASPVEDLSLAMPENADPPKYSFLGRLELVGEATGGSSKVLRGGNGLPDEANNLPECDFEFVQSGSDLIPSRRGLSITTHAFWNIILEPGRAWQGE